MNKNNANFLLELIKKPCYSFAMKINKPKLKDEMERRGVNAKELAAAVGMSIRTVHYILARDKMSWKALEKIAAYFKIDPKDLLIS